MTPELVDHIFMDLFWFVIALVIVFAMFGFFDRG